MTSDLGLLTMNKWLNLKVINHFLDLRNRDLDEEMCITLVCLKDINKRENLDDEIKQLFQSDVIKICNFSQ